MCKSIADRPDSVLFIEVGGAGGVFQHTLATAIAIKTIGVASEVITSTDPELEDDRVNLVRLFDWHRGVSLLRPVRVVWSFLAGVIPSAIRRSREVVWVQGSFKPWLTLLLIVTLRLFGRRVLYSPHNLFARYGGYLNRRLFEACLRAASQLIVYNSVDFEECRNRGFRVSQIPLLMYAPPLSERAVRRWETVVQQNRIDICTVGQLREDKNLPLLVASAAIAGRRLLIAGGDAGAGASVVRAMSDHDNPGMVEEGYLDLEDLAAILYSVGTVALPYSVASQSGVAVLARAYDCHVIAMDVGGLGRQADRVVHELTVEAWAQALREERPKVRSTGGLPEPRVASVEELSALEGLWRSI